MKLSVKYLVLAIIFCSCRTTRNLNVNYSDSVKVSFPIEMPKKTSIEAFKDSIILTLTPGQRLTRETDSTLTIIYREPKGFIIKTIFKPSKIIFDTIIKIDTVFTIKFKELAQKQPKKLFSMFWQKLLLLTVISFLVILLFNRIFR